MSSSIADAPHLCGHGEQRGDAQRHAGRHRLGVQPEVDPGHDDEHAGGHVDGEEVVGELPLEHQHHLEAAVLPRVGDRVAVGRLDQSEVSRGLLVAGQSQLTWNCSSLKRGRLRSFTICTGSTSFQMYTRSAVVHPSGGGNIYRYLDKCS